MKLQIYSYKYKTLKTLFLAVFSFYALFVGRVELAFAETSTYRSAGWVATDGSPAYSSITGCQVSNDGRYCSRPGSAGYAGLFFGSFGQLEDFGIPINSKINKVLVRIIGKNSSSQIVGLTNDYNKMPFASSCLNASTAWTFFLGSIDKSIELNNAIADAKLANCITTDNINFKDLTFVIVRNSPSGWSADIDNFEIAFDYTPPVVTPTPVVFHENQKGTVWEIGPDKSNLAQISGLDNVVSVTTGKAFSMVLKKDGTVWTWTSSDKNPKRVKGGNGVGFLSDIEKITAGNSFGMGLKTDGTVWEWNQVGDEPQIPTVVKIGGAIATDVVDIAAGRMHKLALKSDGKIFGWGLNNDGQIGIGCFLYNCSSVNSPTQVKNIEKVIDISAGLGHSLALKEDGTVWGWGASSGLALGSKIVQTVSSGFSEISLPTQITELSDIKSISSREQYNTVINSSNEIIEWGNYTIGIPRKIEGISNVLDVSAGPSGFSNGVLGHAIKEDGSLWQLYINDIHPKQVPHLKDVVAVASGDQTPSLAVINSAGDVLGDSTGPMPFLDLPWDYENKNNNPQRQKYSFSESALAINSYFDHTYPFLSSSMAEPATASANTMSFRNEDAPEGYSSHDGYDWGSLAHINDGDDVFAAASGSAEIILERNSGGAGNVVKITHPNGYQTWYEHLYADELVSGNVERGDKIGKAGHTGNCYVLGSNGNKIRNTPSCAHIHFSVIQDKNDDKNFSDNIPDGLTDPFGWMATVEKVDKVPDPWEIYSFLQNGIEKKGNKSNYLWVNKIDGLKQALLPTGGSFDVGKNKVELLSDPLLNGLTLVAESEPSAKISENILGIGLGLNVILRDAVGKIVEDLTKPILRITISFTTDQIYRFKEGTLFIYSSPDLKNWKKEDTAIDFVTNKAVIQIDHLTHFALMGERADTIAPTTRVNAEGEKGDQNWFRTDVKLSISANDNEGGLGVEKTFIKVGEEDWLDYVNPLIFGNEGDYEIDYYSEDNDNNVEDVRSYKFNIDKTVPSTFATISGTLGSENWYTSDVKIKLTAQDNASGIDKSEYSTNDGETYQVYEGEFVLSKEGPSEILYRSVDKAGNVEEAKKLALKVDKTTPSSLVYTSGLRGEDNWYRNNVVIALNGNDNVSGYKTSYYSIDEGENYIEYIDPIVLNSEGEHKVSYYSVDNAGNIEDKKSIDIRIDKTLPVVTISVNPTRLWPANGKKVDVRISGGVDENNLFNTSFKVMDEYNLIEPVLTSFNQIIKLQARRNGNDLDGRLYVIEAISSDFAGNDGSARAELIVPHDQR